MFATLVTSCVQATNPFDPDAPPEIQAPSRILGRLTLPGVDLGAAPRAIRLERDGVLELNIATRTSGEALPGTPRAEEGGAGTFDVELAPDVVTLIYDASPTTTRCSVQTAQRLSSRRAPPSACC